MTITKFINHVKRIHRKYPFIWKYGDLRQDATNKCPICAVCYDLTEEIFDNSDYIGAAKRIGLRVRDAESIVAAADNVGSFRLNKRLKSIVK